jgi:hypothetical protein
MAVKKSTRKKVNDPIVDSALRDVYTKLDKLQPSPPNEPYTNLNTPEEGTVTTVEVSGNEAESGTISTAVYTRNGWLVDINSNFKRVGTRGFIASEGTKGRSKIPTQGEALSYDRNRNIKVLNSKGDKALLKNVGGTLQVRDRNDSGDSDVRASRYKFDTGSTFSSLGLGEIFYSHTNNLVGVSANLNITTIVDVVNSSARLEMDALKGDAHIRFKESTVSKWNLGYDYKSNRTVVTDATCDTTNESTTVTFDNGGTADTTSIDGAGVSGSGITNGTYVVSKNASDNTLILSEPATATASNVTLTFDTTTDERFKINSGAFFDGYSTFNLDSNAALELFGTSSSLKLSYDADDSCLISTGANGATTITTVDAAATAAHLLLDIDGDITLDAHGKNIFMGYNGTNTWEFDLNTTTMKIMNSTDTGDYCSLQVGTHAATTLTTVDDDATAAHLTLDVDGDIILDSARGRFSFFDAGDDDDYFHINVVGGTGATAITTVSDNADGHITMTPDGHFEFGSGVGFDLVTPTYNASITPVDFRMGNKQLVTFGAGSITNLNITFPATSGNFVLLLKQDGTGSRTITNYKAYESDGTSADGSAGVVFAGGSNPTFTTDANHVDILSFFWDADNEIAYGVATLDFQF